MEKNSRATGRNPTSGITEPLHPRSHVTFKDEKIMEKLLGINF
jgi:hypothetical protein